MVSLSFANRFGVEHYIVEVRKHAVSGPFSNDAREKSSICCTKASGRFVPNEKKAPKPIGIGASWGEGREERTRNQNVQALSSKASTIRPVAKRSSGSAGSVATCRSRSSTLKTSENTKQR